MVKCIDYLSEIMSKCPNAEFWFLGDFNTDFLKRKCSVYKKGN